MMKAFVAHTTEIDDVSFAVSEILEQLDLNNNLLKNSVGLVSCYSEFIESGVLKAISDAMPFPVIGTTTLSTGTDKEVGQLVLGIMVLTSDDVSFAVSRSAKIENDLKEPLTKAYNEALEKLDAKPKLMITYVPLVFHIAGDMFVEELDKISGGIPNFGTTVIDHTVDYQNCMSIFNGEATRDCTVILLMSGNVNPKFYIAGMAENKIRKTTAIITKSSGNILEEINDMSLAKYLETLGLASDGKISEGINSIPFVIDYNDGTAPVVRVLFAITPEGGGYCGGMMPIGSTLSFGAIDRDDVLQTTEKILINALETEHKDAVIMFSCIGRNLALGLDALAELEAVKTVLNDKIPFIISYSGGEICPVYGENDTLANRYHNDTFVALLL